MSGALRGGLARFARAGACALVLGATAFGHAGELDDAHRHAVVDLIVLAGMPQALDQRLAAFATDMAGKLPHDTPADALAEVVRRIRVAVRPDAILADVAADAAARLSPEQIDAASAALRGGTTPATVLALMNARLARATDRELARASAQVLGEVQVEIQTSTDATDADLARWQRDIAALRERADAIAPVAPSSTASTPTSP